MMSRRNKTRKRQYRFQFWSSGRYKPAADGYEELKESREEDPLITAKKRFQKPPSRIPTKSICLATFLCIAGTSLLVFGMLVLTGHLNAKFADRVWPMIIMGFLMFIPGAYHVRIAYYAYKGYPGYSFDDIPEFE